MHEALDTVLDVPDDTRDVQDADDGDDDGDDDDNDDEHDDEVREEPAASTMRQHVDKSGHTQRGSHLGRESRRHGCKMVSFM